MQGALSSNLFCGETLGQEEHIADYYWKWYTDIIDRPHGPHAARVT